jgi:tRNA1(Val) A37 N6-methylase TrmN6
LEQARQDVARLLGLHQKARNTAQRVKEEHGTELKVERPLFIYEGGEYTDEVASYYA